MDEPDTRGSEAGASPQPNNPFAAPDPTPEELAAVQRANRRRIAIWGMATGAIMALLVFACIGLLVAARSA